MTHTEYTILCNEVNRLNDQYYKNHISEVPDNVFDFYLHQIEEAESEHPEWVTPASPTQHVGSDLGSTPVVAASATVPAVNGGVLTHFAKVSHAVPMLSTAKVKKVEDLVKWMQKTAKKTGDDLFTIEWKYDGLSCSLVYEDGQLVRAATRGNGDTGDDVTAHARLMPTIPNEIPLKGRVEVRGEVVMPFAAFNRWNEEHPNDRLANPRNAASGSLKSLDPNVVVERGLEFYAYDLMVDETTTGQIILDNVNGNMVKAYYPVSWAEHTFYHALNALNNMGFKLLQFYFGRASKEESLRETIFCLESTRCNLPIAVDGLVIKITSSKRREMLGRTDHHPHYLVAYKFGAPTYETVLRKVEYTIGEKTGKHTPVAHFDPVVINGATITKASCGSEATWEKKNLQIGDRILVCLSNDVIPQVVGKA